MLKCGEVRRVRRSGSAETPAAASPDHTHHHVSFPVVAAESHPPTHRRRLQKVRPGVRPVDDHLPHLLLPRFTGPETAPGHERQSPCGEEPGHDEMASDAGQTDRNRHAPFRAGPALVCGQNLGTAPDPGPRGSERPGHELGRIQHGGQSRLEERGAVLRGAGLLLHRRKEAHHHVTPGFSLSRTARPDLRLCAARRQQKARARHDGDRRGELQGDQKDAVEPPRPGVRQLVALRFLPQRPIPAVETPNRPDRVLDEHAREDRQRSDSGARGRGRERSPRGSQPGHQDPRGGGHTASDRQSPEQAAPPQSRHAAHQPAWGRTQHRFDRPAPLERQVLRPDDAQQARQGGGPGHQNEGQSGPRQAVQIRPFGGAGGRVRRREPRHLDGRRHGGLDAVEGAARTAAKEKGRGQHRGHDGGAAQDGGAMRWLHGTTPCTLWIT